MKATPKRTPLYETHLESGGRMVEFAGWEMPVQYQSALNEHLAVRRSAGLFDVSHMGEIEVVGPDAVEAVQWIACNDIEKLEDGQAHYSAFLTPNGGFVDDVIVYRLSREQVLICVNAANKDKAVDWVRGHLRGKAVAEDSSSRFAQLALQGPASERILQRLTPVDLSSHRRNHFVRGPVKNIPTLISRTGYTGEDGFELYLPPDEAPQVWRALVEAGRDDGLIPAGLAARNTLRLEACFPLYGNDIDETVSPLEAGLGWIAKLDRADFIGREALLEQTKKGISRQLTAFELTSKGIVRDGCPVRLRSHLAGSVTSGGWGPTVKRSIGLTYLPSDASDIGQEIEVEVRGKTLGARVVKKPFYKRS